MPPYSRTRLAVQNHHLLRALFYPAITARRLALRHRANIRNHVLDNLCELLVEDPVLEVKEFHGQFVVGSRSDLFRRIAADGKYEPELVQCCIDHLDRNRDAIDVGANIGFFTVLLAKELSGKRVLSVEPTLNAISRLCTNIEKNGVGQNVVVFEGAVSDYSGQAEIKVVVGREEYSSLGSMSHPSISGETHTSLAVTCTTIDYLTHQYSLNPGLVKIDVEGMEHRVLWGMRDTLQRSRPVILSELSDTMLRKNGSSSKEVIDFVRGFGYEIIDPLCPQLPPGTREYGDMLCLPLHV